MAQASFARAWRTARARLVCTNRSGPSPLTGPRPEQSPSGEGPSATVTAQNRPPTFWHPASVDAPTRFHQTFLAGHGHDGDAMTERVLVLGATGRTIGAPPSVMLQRAWQVVAMLWTISRLRAGTAVTVHRDNPPGYRQFDSLVLPMIARGSGIQISTRGRAMAEAQASALPHLRTQ